MTKTESHNVSMEDLVQTLCMLLQSLRVHMSFVHVDLECLDFLVFSIPSSSYILSPYSSVGFHEL